MALFVSQRYLAVNHPLRNPIFDEKFGGLVLHEKTSTRLVDRVPKQPFRLLDLPPEIRRLVFEQYFGHWEVTLDYERLSMLRSKFLIQGVPPFDLLLTSQAIYHETRDLRLRTFNGRLNLNSVFILVPLRRKQRFDWLRQNVRILHFSDSSVHPERWNRYYDNFPNLQILEIEFPHVIGLDDRCASLDQVLEGGLDMVLLESLDNFRLALVDQLSGIVTVMVSQKYRLREKIPGWKGVLDVRIQLSTTGTEIVSRKHDDSVSVITKRQFKSLAEL